MKAVFHYTIAGLLGLASIVWAAPTQLILHPKPVSNTQVPAFSQLKCMQDQCLTACRAQKTIPPIEDGNIRFACY